MNYQYRLRRGLGLVAASLVLSACTILPESAPLAVYQLPPVSVSSGPAAAATPNTAQILQVDTPYSEQLLNSQRILVRPTGSRQVNVYQGAQWADTNPVLLRNRLAAVLRQQTTGLIISTDSTRVKPNWQLKGELSEFQVNYDNDVPVVHIRFNALLVQSAKDHAVVAKSFAIQQPVNGTQLPEVVTAFGLAADQLSLALARWIMQLPLN